MNKWGFLTGAILGLSLAVGAQSIQLETYDFDNVGATLGITQDNKGFIWILNAGNQVFRFDGQRFEMPFGARPEFVPTNEELWGIDLYQDDLLFLYSPSYIYLVDLVTGNSRVITSVDDAGNACGCSFSTKVGPADVVLTCINFRAMREGATNECSVFLRFKDGTLSTIPPDPVEVVEQRFASCFPKIAIDAANTQYFLDGKKITIQKGDSEYTIGLEPTCPGFPQFDSRQQLHFANQLGIFKVEQQQDIRPHAINRHLNALPLAPFLITPNNNIWAATQTENAFTSKASSPLMVYYDEEKDTLFRYYNELSSGLPDNAFHTTLGLVFGSNIIFLDQKEHLWIGSDNLLSKFNFRTPFLKNFQNGILDLAVLKDVSSGQDGAMYALVEIENSHAIYRIDPTKEQVTLLLEGLPPVNEFQALDKGFWLSNRQFFDLNTQSFQPIPTAGGKDPALMGKGLMLDKNGALWMLLDNDLFQLYNTSATPSWQAVIDTFEVSLDNIFLGDFSGKIWLSTYSENVYAYDSDQKQLTTYQLSDVPSAQKHKILEDTAGNIWIGTNAGLFYVDLEKGVQKRYDKTNGLLNEAVTNLVWEGDSCLWIYCKKTGWADELYRLDIARDQLIRLSKEDGFDRNMGNIWKVNDRQFLYTGQKGGQTLISSFHPTQVIQTIAQNHVATRLQLTGVEILDTKADSVVQQFLFSDQPEIDVYHWEKSLKLEYAVTDFKHSDQIEYSYKLKGHDEQWSDFTTTNTTEYISLPYGSYVFEVKAKDIHGLSYPNQLSIPIEVLRPWWRTNLAFLTYFLLLSGLIYFIYSFYRQRQLLLQTQLKQQQAEAIRLQELDQFKSRLYTNLTHEFRTPLTVILGMAEKVRKSPKKYLEEGTRLIERNGNNLLRLINQMLDLSKLENNAFQLHLEQADIIPFLRYSIESFQSFANSKNLSLRLTSKVDALVMDFDEEQLLQVITNLISNAIKFTPSGGEVAVRINQDQKHLQIEVRDTGVGIPAKDLTHIFERFYQVDDTDTRERGGTGIGLAHTYELVKLMNGEVQVDSEVGKGSLFLVRLPIRNEAPLAADKTPIKLDLPDLHNKVSDSTVLNAPTNSNQPRLLIIEDNADVVAYLKTCLEEDYQLDVAFNGAIGIEKALETIPDLIISDVMMPVKDGFEVCDTLKQDERTSHIPIILLTAKADVQSRLAGLERGADAYLAKPFNQLELNIRLKKLFELRQRMQSVFQKQFVQKAGGESAEVAPEAQEEVKIEHVFLQKINKILEAHIEDDDFALPNLCQKVRMSRSQLYRKMKAICDTSPSDYIRNFRLQKAKYLLENTDFNVSEVAFEVGFKDPSHFTKLYKEAFGVAPSATNK